MAKKAKPHTTIEAFLPPKNDANRQRKSIMVPEEVYNELAELVYEYNTTYPRMVKALVDFYNAERA